jgi:ABC-2 type transport system ATP-binding protein
MIQLSNVTKRYGDVVAVDDVSFTVRPGHVTGFVGPNGAGKSTTMRMILGLDRPTSGTVRIDGRPYTELRAPLRVIGALLDASAVDPGRSAAGHLRWLADSNRIGRDRVDAVLDLVGLADVAGRRVGGFSLGMRQRLGIAAALLGDPAIVMFDEPANGLDPDGILWLRAFTRRLATEGRAVFLSSHLINEISRTADHVVVIGRGRLISDAPMSSVLAEHGASTVVVRADRIADLGLHLARHGAATEHASDGSLVVRGLGAAAIGEIAMAERIPLSELTPQEPSLEQAFFDLTHDVTPHASAATTTEVG